MPIILENGHLQTAQALAVPNGSITFQLNIDATVIAAPYGFVSAAAEVVFQLDANGDILPPTGATNPEIYSNAELNPQNSVGLGTYYLVTFYDQNGARLNIAPMWWQFTQAANATVDIGEMIPFATVGGNVIFYPTSFTVPAPGPITLGGVFSNAGAAHEWVSAINTNGSVTLSQPAFSDISGTIAADQLPSGLSFGATTFTGLITAEANIALGDSGSLSGQITFEGQTSGTCTITAPAVAGTSTNPFSFTNSINIPSGTAFSINTDTGISRVSAGVLAVGNGTAGNASGSLHAASLVVSGATATFGTASSISGVITLEGSTSGSCTITAPATAGTSTNPIVISNSIEIPSGTVYQISTDTGLSRIAAGVIAAGNATAGNASGTIRATLFQGAIQDKVQVASTATDAITFPGSTYVTYAGVDAMTLALPTAGAFGTGNDGDILRIVSTTAHAHTITVATAGHLILGGSGGSAYTTATFTDAVVGDFLLLQAYNGYWYVLGTSAGTTWV